jgi:hypothetical protein
MQGRGGVETELQGTYVDKKHLSFSGSIALSFKGTGIGSPDGSLSAQGNSGTVVLKMKYSSPEQKSHSISSPFSSGEQPEGHYNNLKGQHVRRPTDLFF